MAVPHREHDATKLDNGWVVITSGAWSVEGRTEIYDPSARAFRTSLAPLAVRTYPSVAVAASPTSVFIAGQSTIAELWVAGPDTDPPATRIQLDASYVDGWYVGAAPGHAFGR